MGRYVRMRWSLKCFVRIHWVCSSLHDPIRQIQEEIATIALNKNPTVSTRLSLHVVYMLGVEDVGTTLQQHWLVGRSFSSSACNSVSQIVKVFVFGSTSLTFVNASLDLVMVFSVFLHINCSHNWFIRGSCHHYLIHALPVNIFIHNRVNILEEPTSWIIS